jgi:hypothetical protein
MYYIELCIIYIYMNTMYYIVQSRHSFSRCLRRGGVNPSTPLAVTT